MAGRLLSVAVAAVLVHGCLIPQDDPVLSNLPLKKNTSPTLLLETAEPDQRGAILLLKPDCPDKDRRLKIAVSDPDLTDVIESRWYVDPDPDFKLTIPINGESLPTTKTEVRGLVKPLSLLYAPGSPLYEVGFHFVTVVVTDRPFKPDGIGLVLGEFELPDGGTTPDVSTPAQYTWDVYTDRSRCQ